MNNDSNIYEIRLIVAVPNYGEHTVSALDLLLEAIRLDDEIQIIDTFEREMMIVPKGEDDE